MIKAIETRYAGCRFRSRLEARWAVFFDHAGISWEYEPEGFEFDGRYYLPDFKLQCGNWIEVKGQAPADDELNFLRRAGEELGSLILVGPIPELPKPVNCDMAWRLLTGSDVYYSSNGAWVADGSIGFGRYGKNHRPWWLPYTWGRDRSQQLHGIDHTEIMDPHIADAYRAARTARFEHGEAEFEQCGPTVRNRHRIDPVTYEVLESE